MGQTMERMSNEVQELVQKDVGIEDEEEIDPFPMTTNWDEIYQLLAQHPHGTNLSLLPLLPGLLESYKSKKKKPV